MAFYDSFRASDVPVQVALQATVICRSLGHYVGANTDFRPETAANVCGGGFSFYFETPVYAGAMIKLNAALKPNRESASISE